VSTFFDIHSQSLNRFGEELCGDQVKFLRTPQRTVIVLSDGLGSGVKANILATLTSQILLTMLREDVGLPDVVETVIGTLPTYRPRKLAYATFTILDIENTTGRFHVYNFDNPAPFFLKQGKISDLPVTLLHILKKDIQVSEGVLQKGDFLGLATDGVLYAGLGGAMNFGWGRENIAGNISEMFTRRIYAAHAVVNAVMTKTRQLYDNRPGDDATFVGVLARTRTELMIFTGPPSDESHDYLYVDRLLDFPGKKVICGGTTGKIVAAMIKEEIVTDMSTLREDVPPIGAIPGIDLVTEGIITMARVLDMLRECRGDLSLLTADNNGAYLLIRELLLADSIQFLVGQKVNPFYQNPLLPKNVSIRRSVIEQIAAELVNLQKEVHVEYC